MKSPSPSPSLTQIAIDDCLTRLHAHSLAGVPAWKQSIHASAIERLLVIHLQTFTAMGWGVNDLFASPMVLSRMGEPCALDHRKAGLAWHVQAGDVIDTITPVYCIIRKSDGLKFVFERLGNGAQ